MQAGGGQFETIGPCQCAALDERAGKIGRVGERPGHDGVARDKTVGGPRRMATVRKRERQAGGAGHEHLNDLGQDG